MMCLMRCKQVEQHNRLFSCSEGDKVRRAMKAFESSFVQTKTDAFNIESSIFCKM